MAAAAIRGELRAFAAAVTLLTRLPLGRRIAVDETDIARSLAWLPLVGLGLGGAVALAARGLEGRLDDGPAAVLIVAAWALATGAIHLDGLADSADALGAGDRERRLAIMRDPRLGSFGVLALIFVVAAQDRARRRHPRPRAPPLAARDPRGRPRRGLGAERGAAVCARGRNRRRAHQRRPAGRAPGRRARDRDRRSRSPARACAACSPSSPSRSSRSSIGRLAQRRIGGVTGDILGATIELAECAALIALLAGR